MATAIKKTLAPGKKPRAAKNPMAKPLVKVAVKTADAKAAAAEKRKATREEAAKARVRNERIATLVKQTILSMFFERPTKQALSEPIHPSAALVLVSAKSRMTDTGIFTPAMLEMSLLRAFSRKEACEVVQDGLLQLRRLGMAKIHKVPEDGEGEISYKLTKKADKPWKSVEEHIGRLLSS